MAEFELQVVSLVFIVLLSFIYFSKKNDKIVENKYYHIMLYCSIIEVIINTFLHIFAYVVNFDAFATKYYFLKQKYAGLQK